MRNIVAELRALADREGLGLPDEAADEIERFRARVAELEAARGEPVAWQYKVTCDGKGFVDWKAWEQEERPAKIGRWDAEYRALYTAPPAPAVDVDAISDDLIDEATTAFIAFVGDHGGILDIKNYRDDMRAALRTVLNTKDK